MNNLSAFDLKSSTLTMKTVNKIIDNTQPEFKPASTATEADVVYAATKILSVGAVK